MCFFCCVSLRGTVYFMVTVHMIGTFGLFLIGLELFLFPPSSGLPDINLNPAIVSQVPLLVSGYAILACVFGCFLFRAVDMDSVMQLKWSGIGFGVYQSLILFVQFLFSIMFGDLLTKTGQAVLAGILVINFFSSLVYLTVLFLYGKQLYDLKKPRLYRNSFEGLHENNWRTHTQIPNYTKQLNIPDLNFLQNHPSITRTNSVSTSTQEDHLAAGNSVSVPDTTSCVTVNANDGCGVVVEVEGQSRL